MKAASLSFSSSALSRRSFSVGGSSSSLPRRSLGVGGSRSRRLAIAKSLIRQVAKYFHPFPFRTRSNRNHVYEY